MPTEMERRGVVSEMVTRIALPLLRFYAFAAIFSGVTPPPPQKKELSLKDHLVHQANNEPLLSAKGVGSMLEQI